MPRISVLGVNEGNFSYIENTSKYVAREDKCLDGYIGATNVYLQGATCGNIFGGSIFTK